MLATMFNGLHEGDAMVGLAQDADGAYILDCDGPSFRYILAYLRGGDAEVLVSLPETAVERQLLAREAEYFMLDELAQLCRCDLHAMTHTNFLQLLRISKLSMTMPYTDLRFVRLAHQNLAGFDLCGCDFSNVDMRQTILSGTNLRGANLEGANLTGVVLDLRIDTASRWANTRLDGAVMPRSASDCQGLRTKLAIALELDRLQFEVQVTLPHDMAGMRGAHTILEWDQQIGQVMQVLQSSP
jgi:hypothetical protein